MYLHMNESLTSNAATTIPLPNTTTPSDEKYMNSPETLLKLIAKEQKEIKEKEEQISRLKHELDVHLHLGTVGNEITHDGIKATRITKQGKWVYSEFCDELAKDLKRKLDQQMEIEREDLIAKQNPPTCYWRISKND